MALKTSSYPLEERLDAAIIIPPKADDEKYDLFKAVHVKVTIGRCAFSPLGIGITDTLLETNNLTSKIPEFNRLRRLYNEAHTTLKHLPKVSNHCLP